MCSLIKAVASALYCSEGFSHKPNLYAANSLNLSQPISHDHITNTKFTSPLWLYAIGDEKGAI